MVPLLFAMPGLSYVVSETSSLTSIRSFHFLEGAGVCFSSLRVLLIRSGPSYVVPRPSHVVPGPSCRIQATPAKSEPQSVRTIMHGTEPALSSMHLDRLGIGSNLSGHSCILLGRFCLAPELPSGFWFKTAASCWGSNLKADSER